MTQNKLAELNTALMDVLGIDYKTKRVRSFSVIAHAGEPIVLNVEYMLLKKEEPKQIDSQTT